MRIALATVAILAAGAAHAEAVGTVQLGLGFSAESEYDEGKVKAGGQTTKFDGDDEDLESNFGVAATYEFFLMPNLSIGPRLAFMTGEGDDSDNVLHTFDIGGMGRFFFNSGAWRGFAGLGVGATYATLTNDDSDLDGSGIGYHFLLGAGVQGSLTPSVGLIAGLYYEYIGVGSTKGDGKVNGTKVDVELEDGVVTRPMLTAGVAF